MKTLIKTLSLFLLSFFFTNASTAATYTFTNSWVGGTPTLATGDIVNVTAGIWSLSANTTIATLNLQGGTVDLGNYTLTTTNLNTSNTSAVQRSSTSTGILTVGSTTTIGGKLTIDYAEVRTLNLTWTGDYLISSTNGGIFAFTFNTSTANTISGTPSSARHISGKVRIYVGKDINTAARTYTLPIGDNSNVYAPIRVVTNSKTTKPEDLPTTGTANFIEATYFGTSNSITSVNTSTLPGGVSMNEYWVINTSNPGTTNAPAATYNFNFLISGLGKTTLSSTNSITNDVKLAQISGSSWNILTGTTITSVTGGYNIASATNTALSSTLSFGSSNANTTFLQPLPVSIIDFSAKANENNIEIKWSTASEKDNAAFEVEKSFDGQTWSSIGTVQGARTSNVVNNYVLVDNKAVAGFQYYRLKQIDLDGSVSYSKAIAVNFSKTSTLNVNLSPNPAKDVLNISTDNNATGEVNIQILNFMGQTVYNKIVDAGLVQSIDISSFNPGVYYVSVIADGESKIIRLLKN